MAEIAVFALVLAVYSIFSRRLEASIFSAPMVFVAVGLALSLNPINVLSLQYQDVDVLLVGEVALVLILFSDAMRVQVHDLQHDGYLPGRLLTIGLALTIAAGAAIATVMFTSLSFWEAAALAAILAPTDAGLGHAVITDHRVPARIRNTVNVESGLNDGIVTPFFIIFVGIVEAEEDQATSLLSGLRLITEDIAVGVLVGLAIGFVGASLVRWSRERNWMSHISQRTVYPAIAVLAWQMADHLHGNGFVAAFVAGVVTAWVIKTGDDGATDFIEVSGELAVLVVFFVFGIIATNTLGDIAVREWIYALLSLTIIRMAPVALALVRTRLAPGTALFIGWFGPRGLASIVLLLLLINESPSIEGIPTISRIVTATVLISIFAHGVSSNPLVTVYNRMLAKLPADAPEFGETGDVRARLSTAGRISGSSADSD